CSSFAVPGAAPARRSSSATAARRISRAILPPPTSNGAVTFILGATHAGRTSNSGATSMAAASFSTRCATRIAMRSNGPILPRKADSVRRRPSKSPYNREMRH
ncbi:MAG: Sarcosine oxidase delta subunit, partial [uncultured Microvirga sp.]